MVLSLRFVSGGTKDLFRVKFDHKTRTVRSLLDIGLVMTLEGNLLVFLSGPPELATGQVQI